MGASARPEDPRLRLQYLKETGQAEEAALYEQYLRETNQAPVDPKTAARQAEFKSGRMEARHASENLLDRANNRSYLDEVGAGLQNMVGQGTFGAVGLLDDAVSSLGGPGSFGERFRASREARKSSREALPTSARILTGVSGAVANPVNRILPVAKAGAGLLSRAALGTGEAALQGGLAELGENVGAEGAVGETVKGAVGGMAGRAALGAGSSLLGGARTLARVANAAPVETSLLRRTDTRKLVDDVMFGAVRQEAGQTGTSPAIRYMLDDETVAPFAKIVRDSREFKNADDAVVFLEAYKRMSEVQRTKVRQMEGAPEFLASVAQKLRDIGGAKSDLRTAAEFQDAIPTFGVANETSAKSASEIAAYKRTSDIIDRVIHGKKVNPNKMGKTSPEVALREMQTWTPEQAQAGLEALYATGKTAPKLTDQPLSGFGLIPSAIRLARLPERVRPFVRVLEEQALLRDPVPSLAERLMPARSARVGGLLGSY